MVTRPNITKPIPLTVMDCEKYKALYLPRVLPAHGRILDEGIDGNRYQLGDLRVIASFDREMDYKIWYHVSMSHADRLPTYAEMVSVKELFIGLERTALQVFPPRSKHVNQHPYCLHLWCCLSGDVTPDFTRGGESI